MPTKTGNVLNWASDLDPKALDQAERSARLPFLAGHLALMPDAHWGLGATVGSVIPTVGAIVPAAVGVDIGCGMIAAETTLNASDLPDNLDGLQAEISGRVPAGVGQGHESFKVGKRLHRLGDYRAPIKVREHKVARQMGTLGSGNHFVEVCLDEDETVWVVLHSGSRGIGNQLARYHIDQAKGLMAKLFIELEDPDLAYLVQHTAEFDDYIHDLRWAQNYALANRETMMDSVLAGLEDVLAEGPGWMTTRRVNCHHNYTEMENHHGKNVWVTRKGAIRARVGDLGVIPGSMGTDSFIVEGLGNPSSYHSAPHGAGRKMSRGQARRTLDVETFTESMAGKSWQESDAGALLDEDPRAYKDIETVIRDSADLARPVRHLHQILNYKGT
jgi:tRNA-splicing ligase RtcB